MDVADVSRLIKHGPIGYGGWSFQTLAKLLALGSRLRQSHPPMNKQIDIDSSFSVHDIWYILPMPTEHIKYVKR